MNKKTRLRKCEVTRNDSGKEITSEYYFHKWIEQHNKVTGATETLALLEKENGEIVTRSISRLVFID